MDTTLSASVSSFNLPSLPPLPQPPLRSISRRFKATINTTPSSSSSTNLSKRTPSSPSSSYSHNKNSSFCRVISLPHTKPSRAPLPPPVHDKAASGFAAALVSVCQSKNRLGQTGEDVRKLMKFLVREEKKRNKVLVNDIVEIGKFGKCLKGLVNMLIAKGKSWIIVDVLMEFEKICNELVVVDTSKLVRVS